MASYQQAGDFEVVNVDGRIRRNGGNVASYFCTPDGDVIHAVGGPVAADRLRQAADWAISTYEYALQLAPENDSDHRRIFEKAHLAELHTTPDEFERALHKQLADARKEYQRQLKRRAKRRKHSRNQNDQSPVASAETLARRRAARQFKGDRAHQILAAEPLAPFTSVRAYAFEKLTGEQFVQQRGRIFASARDIERAAELHRPMLLVLYNGHGKYKDEMHRSTKEQLDKLLDRQPASDPLRHYTVVKLPLRELAALSQVADIPNYEVTNKSSPVFIVTRSDGTQVRSMSGHIDPNVLAAQLWKPIHDRFLARAEEFVARKNMSEAFRLLDNVAAKSGDKSQRRKAVERIQALRLDLADRWASEGRTEDALRLLEKVQSVTSDEKVRHRAAQRLTEIQISL